MPEPDSVATQKVKISQAEETTMPGVTDPYLREQLELRRGHLREAISAPNSEQHSGSERLVELLAQVDSAVQRMDAGSYGICDVCHDTIEKERLIADPLMTVCLDHFSGEEQRALERDLELASQIQRGLLPQANLRAGDWEIHYRYQPAGVVSGDYCDVISPANRNGQLIFLLGDVSGKGVAAALLMSHLQAMFRSLSAMRLDLGRLLETANRLFCESTLAGQYATLICGKISQVGAIDVASAGHVPALLVTKAEVKQIGSTGLPLGMFRTSRYAVESVRLDPGDCLLLFTDGILEARGPSSEEYGIGRISIAAKQWRGLTPGDLAVKCLEDVARHSAGSRQADDQTLMVVQRAV